jgi:hypothetical protein
VTKIAIDVTPGNTGAGLTPLNLCRNGGLPTAEGVRALADVLNFLATRGQAIAAHTSAVSEVFNFDTAENTDRAGWRWAFRTSKNARQLLVNYVLAPAGSSGTTTQPSLYLGLSEGLTRDTGVLPMASVKSTGRKISASITADDLFLRTQVFDVSGDTEYRLQLHLINRAAVASITISELVLPTAETTQHEVVNTSLITGHGPILTTTMTELVTVARQVWRRPKMLMSFSAEHGFLNGNAGGTAAVLTNALDSGYTTASANSPGTPVDLSRDGTLESTEVPVVFAVHAGRSGAATSATIELRDQANTIVAQISAALNAPSSGADGLLSGWYTASGKLSTSTTKLDLFYRRSSGTGTVEITAAQVWRRHPVHPRDISGLAAWYDASQITGVSGGAALASWPDQSGNGYNLTMVGSPTYQTAVLGGLPVVRLNGLTQYGRHSDPGAAAYRSSTVTLFVVAKATSATPVNPMIFAGYAHSAAAGGARWRYGIKAAGGGMNLMLNNVDDTSVYAAPTASLTGFSIHTYSTDNRWIGLHGNFVSDEVGGGAITYPNTTGLHVGCSNAFAPEYFDGDIAEVLVFSRALSLSERHDVEHYLACKWGLNTATLS